MNKVVYLFGAGASFGVRDENNPRLKYDYTEPRELGTISTSHCRCPNITEGLPIVSELPERMKFILSKVNRVMLKNPARRIIQQLSDDIKWLHESSVGHSTVDTFAKKLWLTCGYRGTEYSRLKRTLSAYFMLEQLFSKVDKRYDAFYASILGNSVNDFPKNIRILSWNYDSQFELSYAKYLGDECLADIENALHLYNKTTGNRKYENDDSFSITKLNGTALIYDINSRALLDPFFNRQGMSEINYVATLCSEAINTKSALSFAWENLDDWFSSGIRKSVEGAKVLVVIGYSFPFFNRVVDRMIFESMPTLEKIYVQDLKPHVIIESLNNFYTPDAVKPQMIPISNTRQFYLPPEL